MKISDIRNLDNTMLFELLSSLRRELFDIKMKFKLRSTASPAMRRPKLLRQDVARILTELRARGSEIV